MSDLITSPSNPLIVRVRGLLARRDRRTEEGAFVVEGDRAVSDALDAGMTPRILLLREDIIAPDNLPAGIEPRYVATRIFDDLSDVANPQGVLAVVPMPDLQIDPAATPLILVIDRMRDPGNLGSLLRAAAGAGVTAVYLTTETVDPFNPKVVRAGMGAHWRLPIQHLSSQAADEVRGLAPSVVITAANAPVTYDEYDWTRPAVVVIGSEAHGIGPALAAVATDALCIPLAAGVESLNAATAGAVVLFEAARQRRIAL
ncbi:MAG: TrmH family RNA methyltransferase [Thermomicrobiales bacterium]